MNWAPYSHHPLLSLSTGDWILVGATGAILIGVGLLQRSLGDVIRDEAQLPSASSARTKREANRSKRFLDPKKRPPSSNKP
ncbi:hypothetical protein Gasu2_13790 [Galdieria sulphuraria]|nr:hypothetical protein Gasu2_13790 [Galdieria sulphuraria]